MRAAPDPSVTASSLGITSVGRRRAAMAEVVEASGLLASLKPGRPARPGRRLLRLGPSFVIARALRFAPRPERSPQTQRAPASRPAPV